MRRFHSLEDAARAGPPRRPRVATVGFFDGVHRGHIRTLDHVKSWARSVDGDAVVVTFDRHPQAVLGGHPPVPVVSLEHRLILLEREGISATLVLPFDEELARWSPERFVERVLTGALGARRLTLGFDGAFGCARRGDYDYLRERQSELGLEVQQTDALHVDGERVSSSLLRAALRDGRLDRARSLLGRRFSLFGRVVPGDRRGRTIGFPTANLDIGDAAVLPRGVYFGDVLRLGDEPLGGTVRGADLLPCVVNMGRCPTFTGEMPEGPEAFDPRRDRVEVHIPGFDGDLYGECLEVFIDGKHRSELRFETVDALVDQIRSDVRAMQAARANPL